MPLPGSLAAVLSLDSLVVALGLRPLQLSASFALIGFRLGGVLTRAAAAAYLPGLSLLRLAIKAAQ